MFPVPYLDVLQKIELHTQEFIGVFFSIVAHNQQGKSKILISGWQYFNKERFDLPI